VLDLLIVLAFIVYAVGAGLRSRRLDATTRDS
jgi:hypothetical protein